MTGQRPRHYLDLAKFEDPQMKAVLAKALLRAGLTVPAPGDAYDYWDWDGYEVSPAQLPRQCDPAAVLRARNIFRITELSLLEAMGLEYNAKLVLQAQTYEEKMMYGCFYADELRHAALLRPYAPAQVADAHRCNPVIDVIWQVTDKSHPLTVLLMIQVLLEGFGVRHYSQLGASCRHPHLSRVLASIATDEAAHHGVGAHIQKTRGKAAPTPPQARGETVTLLLRLIDTYRAWPSTLLRAIEVSHGPQPERVLADVVERLDVEGKAQAYLAGFDQLVRGHFPDDVLGDLDRARAFRAEGRAWALNYYLASPLRPGNEGTP